MPFRRHPPRDRRARPTRCRATRSPDTGLRCSTRPKVASASSSRGRSSSAVGPATPSATAARSSSTRRTARRTRGRCCRRSRSTSSRLRALETGRWVAQVAPTGFTAFIDDTGHLKARTAISERKVLQMDGPQARGRRRSTCAGATARSCSSRCCSSRSASSGIELEQDGHWPVVDELDRHRRCESGRWRHVGPSSRSASTTASTSGSATSGGAAASHDGRRPLLVSP